MRLTELVLLQHDLTERFQKEYIDKKTLYECIGDIWSTLKLYFPFHPCEVIFPLEKYLTVEFRNLKNNKFCGVINKKMIPEKSFIYINNNNPPATQLFSLYHEIMHWFFHTPAISHYNIKGIAALNIDDYHANEGAAEMIVPHFVFIPWIAQEINRRKRLDAEDIREIKEYAAREFNTSPAIIYYRLEGLKYELWQYLHGTDLSRLKFLSKKQLATKNINIGSLNDTEWIIGKWYSA